MDEDTRRVLHKLREDEMDIEEAIKVLNITEEEIWNLLDDFEYFPSGEVLTRACQIEKKSLKKLQKRMQRDSRGTSRPSKDNITTKMPSTPSDHSTRWLGIRVIAYEGTAPAEEPIKPPPLKLSEEKENEFLRLFGASDTSKGNLSLLQRS